MRRSIRLTVVAALATFAFASPAAAAPKVGADDLAALEVQGELFTVESGDAGGGTTRCAAGQRVMTGGAYFEFGDANPHAQDLVLLSSSSPTRDGRGWFAAGRNVTGQDGNLVVVAQCLPATAGSGLTGADDLAPYKVRTKTFTSRFDARRGGVASCPDGSRAITGGAFVSEGSAAVARARSTIPDSTMTRRADGWYAAGDNFGKPRRFNVLVQCLKRTGDRSRKIGADDLAAFERTVETYSVKGGPFEDPTKDGGFTNCDGGSRLVSGGAEFFKRGGGRPDPRFQSSAITAATAWFANEAFYATAHLFGSGRANLVVAAQCLPRTPG